MFCGKCGSIVPDGNAFCPNCGSPLNEPAVNAPAPNIPVQPYMPSMPVQPVPIIMSAPERPRKNGMATAGLVFGILGAVFSLGCLGSYSTGDDSSTGGMILLVYSFAILGVIFSAIGIGKSRSSGSKGKAVTGLILSILSFFLPILFLGMGTYMYKAKSYSATAKIEPVYHEAVLEDID